MSVCVCVCENSMEDLYIFRCVSTKYTKNEIGHSSTFP